MAILRFIEVSTFDLTGKQLDWAVAQSVGIETALRSGGMISDDCKVIMTGNELFVWSPSTNWQQAGPLIERFWREITSELFDWHGYQWTKEITGCELVWLCRALVCAKFGLHVSIPEVLV